MSQYGKVTAVSPDRVVLRQSLFLIHRTIERISEWKEISDIMES